MNVEKFILQSILATFGILAIVYMLVLGNMVLNIVERKALEKEALALSNEVGQMELDYLSLSQSIDVGMSSMMGFKEIKPTFATRKSLGFGYGASEALALKQASNEI